MTNQAKRFEGMDKRMEEIKKQLQNGSEKGSKVMEKVDEEFNDKFAIEKIQNPKRNDMLMEKSENKRNPFGERSRMN